MKQPLRKYTDKELELIDSAKNIVRNISRNLGTLGLEVYRRRLEYDNYRYFHTIELESDMKDNKFCVICTLNFSGYKKVLYPSLEKQLSQIDFKIDFEIDGDFLNYKEFGIDAIVSYPRQDFISILVIGNMRLTEFEMELLDKPYVKNRFNLKVSN